MATIRIQSEKSEDNPLGYIVIEEADLKPEHVVVDELGDAAASKAGRSKKSAEPK